MPRLANRDAFPSMTAAKVGGGTITLPKDLAGSYGVVLAYRGDWCPFCDAQLADFAAHSKALKDLGVRVVALSVDEAAKGAALVAKHHIDFAIGYNVDAEAFAAQTGAFVNPSPRYLQPTDFIVAPDGTVAASVYASHAIGRLNAADVLKLVAYLKSQAAA